MPKTRIFGMGEQGQEIILFWRACMTAWTPGLYMSTAGNGVAWLHMRMSATPKYYKSSFKPPY